MAIVYANSAAMQSPEPHVEGACRCLVKDLHRRSLVPRGCRGRPAPPGALQ